MMETKVKKKKKKKKDSTPTEDTGAADSGGERDQEWERGDEEEDGARASAEDADDFPPGEFSSQPRNPTPKKKKVRDQDAEPAQQKTKKPKKKFKKPTTKNYTITVESGTVDALRPGRVSSASSSSSAGR